MKLTKLYKGNKLTFQVHQLGSDLNVLIYGGETPHIGAIALASRSPVHNKPDIYTTTVSLITLPGHKDDLLARDIAQSVSKNLDKTVSVSCGIHYNNISIDDIEEIAKIINNIGNEFIENYKTKGM